MSLLFNLMWLSDLTALMLFVSKTLANKLFIWATDLLILIIQFGLYSKSYCQYLNQQVKHPVNLFWVMSARSRNKHVEWQAVCGGFLANSNASLPKVCCIIKSFRFLVSEMFQSRFWLSKVHVILRNKYWYWQST